MLDTAIAIGEKETMKRIELALQRRRTKVCLYRAKRYLCSGRSGEARTVIDDLIKELERDER